MNYRSKYQFFYNSPEWKALRNLKFADAKGLCERCLKKGVIREGKEIHHIEPIEKNWDKRFDYDNLMCLCSDCHNEMHERVSPLQKFNAYWEELNAKKAESNT